MVVVFVEWNEKGNLSMFCSFCLNGYQFFLPPHFFFSFHGAAALIFLPFVVLFAGIRHGEALSDWVMTVRSGVVVST